MPGFVAILLMLGFLLPLASAPADFAAFVITRLVVERVSDRAPGPWGLAGHALLAFAGAGFSLLLLAAGLWVVLWLYALVAPAGYGFDPAAWWAAIRADPWLGWPVWVLAALKFLPFFTVLAQVLAVGASHRSAAMRQAVQMLASGAPAAAPARLLLRARLAGWLAAGLVLGLPLVLLALATARP